MVQYWIFLKIHNTFCKTPIGNWITWEFSGGSHVKHAVRLNSSPCCWCLVYVCFGSKFLRDNNYSTYILLGHVLVARDLQLGVSHQDTTVCGLPEDKQQKKGKLISVEPELDQDQHVLQCDFCETWEHVECIRWSDRISGELYDMLVENRSKALLFCCTTCRRKGSIVNQLHKLRSDVTIEDGQQLASVRAVNEAREIVRSLRADIPPLVQLIPRDLRSCDLESINLVEASKKLTLKYGWRTSWK